LRAALVGLARAAGVERDRPVVQRTRDARAEHDSLRQRAALVRATVEQGEDGIVAIAEDRDVAGLARDDARAEHGDVVEGADVGPAGAVVRKWAVVPAQAG